MENLNKFLNNNILTDVDLTIIDSNKVLPPIKLHRLVLSLNSVFFEKLFTADCKEKNSSDVSITVPNADITYDIITSFYRENINTTNLPHWQYLLDQLRCYDYLQLPLIKFEKDLNQLVLPKDDIIAFEYLLDMLQFQTCSEWISQAIANNIPNGYNLSGLSDQLIKKIEDLKPGYDIMACGFNSGVYLFDIKKNSSRLLFYENRNNCVKWWDSLNLHFNYSPTEKIFIMTENQIMTIFDLQTHNKQSKVFNSIKHTAMCFSEHSKIIAIGDDSGRVHFYELEKQCFQKILNAHVRSIYSMAYSLDGKQLVTTAYDDSIHIWNTTNNNLIKSHSLFSRQIVYCPNNKYFAAVNRSNIIFFDKETADIIFKLDNKGSFGYICFSPDGEQIAATVLKYKEDKTDSDCEDVIQIYDVQERKLVREISTKIVGSAKTIIWSPDNMYIAIGSERAGPNKEFSNIHVYHAQTGRYVQTIHTTFKILGQMFFIKHSQK